MKKFSTFPKILRLSGPKGISHFSFSRGFTLVELMIVIAIIGILSSLGLNSYTSIQQRARDAQRKSDVQQIRIALEVIRSDYDSYPSTAVYDAVTCKTAFIVNGNTYMQSLPCDPTLATRYIYSSIAPGSSYSLVACLENTNDKDATTPYAGCGTPGYAYATSSP